MALDPPNCVCVTSTVRPIRPPGDGIGANFVHFDEPDERPARFLAMLEDRHQQIRDAAGRQHHQQQQRGQQQGALKNCPIPRLASAARPSPRIGCRFLTVLWLLAHDRHSPGWVGWLARVRHPHQRCA